MTTKTPAGSISIWNRVPARIEERPMTICFELPPNIEQQAHSNGADLNCEAKVAYLVNLYRRERITRDDLSEALGLGFHQTEQLLKEHGVGDDFALRGVPGGASLPA